MKNKMLKQVTQAIQKLEGCYEEGCLNCTDLAIAAIEAMKEPTDDMISSVRFDTNMDHVQTYRIMVMEALK